MLRLIWPRSPEDTAAQGNSPSQTNVFKVTGSATLKKREGWGCALRTTVTSVKGLHVFLRKRVMTQRQQSGRAGGERRGSRGPGSGARALLLPTKLCPCALRHEDSGVLTVCGDAVTNPSSRRPLRAHVLADEDTRARAHDESVARGGLAGGPGRGRQGPRPCTPPPRPRPRPPWAAPGRGGLWADTRALSRRPVRQGCQQTLPSFLPKCPCPT